MAGRFSPLVFVAAQIAAAIRPASAAGFHCRNGHAADASLHIANLLAETQADRPMLCTQLCAVRPRCVAATHFAHNRTCVLTDTMDFVRWPGAKMCTTLPYDPGTIALGEPNGGGKIHIFGGGYSAAVPAHQIYEPLANGGAGATSIVPHDEAELPVLTTAYAAWIGCCKIYLIGGMAWTPAGGTVGNLDVYVFNVATGQWGKDRPISIAHAYFVGATHRNRIYVCAGVSGGWNVTCFVYAPGRGELVEDYTRYYGGGTGKARRQGNGAVVGDTFYYVGGKTGYTGTPELLSTDEHMVEWRTDLALLPHFMEDGFAIGHGGQLHYCAGDKWRSGVISSVHRWCRRYNAVADAWVNIANHPQLRFGGGVVLLHGDIYLVAGRTSQTLVERYDVAADAWTTLANRIAAAAHYPAVVAIEH